MVLTVYQKRRYRQTIQLIVAGLFLALIYVGFAYGFESPVHLIDGAVTGILVGATVALIELYILRRSFRRMNFLSMIVIRVVIYSIPFGLILLNETIISRMIRFDQSYLDVLGDPGFQSYVTQGRFQTEFIFTVIFALLVNFNRLMTRKIGQGVVLDYIRGTYYKPVQQDRTVMFLSIQNAQEIAAQIGSVNFLKFLNQYYHDITPAFVQNSGIIYEYVEDLIVVTWTENNSASHHRSFSAFTDVQKTIKQRADYFERKFQCIPEIQAAIHGGSVVRAEIGEIKTHTTLHGDCMNTAARILHKCPQFNAQLIVSEEIATSLNQNMDSPVHSIGKIPLKGVQKDVSLYSPDKVER